jgi:hypothetical protein
VILQVSQQFVAALAASQTGVAFFAASRVIGRHRLILVMISAVG